jgi:Raf kinase inhibitor-like YbhB/YbcL family protein
MKALSACILLLSALGFAQTPTTTTPQQDRGLPETAAPPRNPARPAQPRLTLSTTAFEDGGIIPDRFTSKATPPATPVSPNLTWTEVPDGTVSFALILVDPDTALRKSTEQYIHWVLFNIPGSVRDLPEAVPGGATLPDGSIQGLNSGKHNAYAGMGAPAGGPFHHYLFELYALDTKLSLGPDTDRAGLLKAMDGHILAKADLVGRFHR